MSNERLGKDWKLYVSTVALADLDNATIDALTWAEFDIIESVETSNEREEISFKTRENGGQEQTVAGALSSSLDLSWVYKKGDATGKSIEDAVKNGTALAIADLDGDIDTTGTYGTIGNFSALSHSRSEPIDGVVQLNVTLKPADAVYDMGWERPAPE